MSSSDVVVYHGIGETSDIEWDTNVIWTKPYTESHKI